MRGIAFDATAAAVTQSIMILAQNLGLVGHVDE
jgi:hypothetical protein